jgi:signal peptidase II
VKVLFSTLFVVILDQVTKFLVKGGVIPLLNIKVDGMTYGQSINVFGDFFKITFVENPGLAFGIDVNETSKLILSIFTLFASIGIFYYLYKSRDQRFAVRMALALILGGAIGNLIDRTFYGLFYNYAPIFYGKVVDFFNVDFFDFTIFGRTFDRWPIFNIADSAVSIGVVLLLIFHRTAPVQVENVEKNISGNIIETPAIDSVSIKNESSENSELVTNNSSIDNGENSNREENSN